LTCDCSGMGRDRSRKGSKQLDVCPHVLHSRTLTSCPPNDEMTCEKLLS